MNRTEIVRTTVFILVITVIIAAGLTYANPERWFDNLVGSFVFSSCIGLSIKGLLRLFMARLEKLPPLRRGASLFLIYLVAGFAGTEVGYAFFKYVYFSGQVDASGHTRLLLLNLILAILFGSISAVYYSMLRRASVMARRLREKEINEERLERLRTSAELEALQSKVNPHFLFNTLNSIASLIAENPASAEATVEKLSELFRYTLQRSQNSTVRLSEELQIVRSYLEIEKVRFGERLRYEIRAENGLDDVAIPPLLIQPLVENSIKHVIAADPSGGSIDVEVARQSGTCVIAVRDSGKGIPRSDGDPGFGLRSIRERLSLMYGDRASLHIRHEDPPEIRITIPLQER